LLLAHEDVLEAHDPLVLQLQQLCQLFDVVFLGGEGRIYDNPVGLIVLQKGKQEALLINLSVIFLRFTTIYLCLALNYLLTKKVGLNFAAYRLELRKQLVGDTLLPQILGLVLLVGTKVFDAAVLVLYCTLRLSD